MKSAFVSSLPDSNPALFLCWKITLLEFSLHIQQARLQVFPKIIFHPAGCEKSVLSHLLTAVLKLLEPLPLFFSATSHDQHSRGKSLLSSKRCLNLFNLSLFHHCWNSCPLSLKVRGFLEQQSRYLFSRVVNPIRNGTLQKGVLLLFIHINYQAVKYDLFVTDYKVPHGMVLIPRRLKCWVFST